MIQVITCHFNPCCYRAPLENYFAFRKHMEQFGVSVRTIELIYDDRPSMIPGAMHVRGSSVDSLLWQKESLLNALIDTSSAEYIAWIDPDLYFTNPSWVLQAEYALRESYDVIQLFYDARVIEKTGTVSGASWPSVARAFLSNERFWDFSKYHAGFAWAARGDWLRKHRLYDKLVAGCGDTQMALAWCCRPDVSGWNPELAADYTKWVVQQGTVRVGCIPGTVMHMYHGSNANRRRGEQRMFHAHVAPSHFTRSDDGVLSWTDKADPAVVRAIRERFYARNEDA